MNVMMDRVTRPVRELLDGHPEWWLVVLGAAAWTAMLRHGVARWGHEFHYAASVWTSLAEWHTMVLAMMLPTIVWHARAVAVRSMAERRHYAIAQHVLGYIAPWSVFGAAAAIGISFGRDLAPLLTIAACIAATGWVFLPVRERAMMMVHTYAPILAPEGWAAARDTVASGAAVGIYCVVACWPVMLACAFSNHHPAAIVAGAIMNVAEIRSFRTPRRFLAASAATLTLVLVVLRPV